MIVQYITKNDVHIGIGNYLGGDIMNLVEGKYGLAYICCACMLLVTSARAFHMDTSIVPAETVITDANPVILAGDDYFDPPDQISYRVDPNTVDSPYNGVVSVGIDGVFIGSGTMITPTKVMTCAHLFDLDHDGVCETSPSSVTVHLNYGGNSTHILQAVDIVCHPDYTGFNNPTLNDDLAIVTLDTPVPAGVTIYPILRRPMLEGDELTLVGYGRSGYGSLGFAYWPPFENFNIKRSGKNVADLSFLDDEYGYFAEVYTFDFDDPVGDRNVLGSLSLGNLIETTLGYGDSGGPAFVEIDGQLYLAGVNTYIARFTEKPWVAPQFGSAGGGMILFPYGQWFASHTDIEWNVNILRINSGDTPVYVQPGEIVVAHLNVENLAQKITGLQALINFSSTHFSTDTGDVSVVAAGGVWDVMIYNQYTVEGDLDVAVGVDLEYQAGAGTDEDATTTIITLVAQNEGQTTIEFRPEPDIDPALNSTTLLSDVYHQSVMPVKVNSNSIIIDGTDPTVSNLTAIQVQYGQTVNVLECTNTTLQGQVELSVQASDTLAGLEPPPAITVSNGVHTLPVTFTTENPTGVYNYTVEIQPSTPDGTWNILVEAQDRAENTATLSAQLCVDTSQITGSLELQAFSGSQRMVTFTASGGTHTQTWTRTLEFTGGLADYLLTGIPSGTTNLSAKTQWNLRRRLPVSLDAYEQASNIDFIGPDMLRGGDLNNSNNVNILDYALLRMNWLTGAGGDIDGSGHTNLLDYTIMLLNWYEKGDPE